jgi:hypothetical protein
MEQEEVEVGDFLVSCQELEEEVLLELVLEGAALLGVEEEQGQGQVQQMKGLPSVDTLIVSCPFSLAAPSPSAIAVSDS